MAKTKAKAKAKIVKGKIDALRNMPHRKIIHTYHNGKLVERQTVFVGKKAVGEKVNHPSHYGGADNQYESIKVIRACWQKRSKSILRGFEKSCLVFTGGN